MSAPVIVAAARTPIGTTGGALREVTVDALVTPLVERLVAQCPEPERLLEVALGNIRGPGGNLARYCALAAGLPETVPGVTIDRQCGSALAAVEYAGYLLQARPGFVIAGGAQSASTQPLTFWPGEPPVEYTRAPMVPETIGDPDMGLAADLLAEERGISRERQDAYAARSHARAIASQHDGVFDTEICPVAGVTRDERPRDRFTPERLARFRPVFRENGTLTVANSCGVNDGGAAVLLCDAATQQRLALPGLRVVTSVTTGCDPSRPGFGAVPAAQQALSEAGLSPAELDAVEINEAFAGQVLACLDVLGIPEERNCRQGGALAIGHPWAASGAVLLTRLFTQLVATPGRRGLAAIAIAGGMGTALVVESC